MNDDLAVFIMVWGRPEKMWTLQTLRRQGYTGKIYLVGDDQDEKIDDYRKKYGDDLLVFSKNEVKEQFDAGDNSGDLRSTMYAVNVIPRLAKEKGVKYFFIFCDDYTQFQYKYDSQLNYKYRQVKNLDRVFDLLLAFYKKTSAVTISFMQTGDFIGAGKGTYGRQLKMSRKSMNTFLCSTDRPFQFLGRINEDVTTYVNLGNKGGLFLSVPNVALSQKPTQSESGGLTDLYLDYGTYIKSFFSVMYNPSCVKVAEMGEKHKRLHHRVLWNKAVPKILDEKYRHVL